MPVAQEAPSIVIRDDARRQLFHKYRDRIEPNGVLSRSLVSYQSNKGRPYYRWFKYKEGFSAALVEYLLHQAGVSATRLLDPFAGSGAALFAARDSGLTACGIELLPVGTFAMSSRLVAEQVAVSDFRREVSRFFRSSWRKTADPELAFSHIAITAGAFPPETEHDLVCFRTYVRDRIKDEAVQQLFQFACMSVLESVSYTRKDGQYLRWDSRSPRNLQGKPFDKGHIPEFESALRHQFRLMTEDMEGRDLFSATDVKKGPTLDVQEGSCLEILPTMREGAFDLVITSPPYCNRYDYTRTYALELAFLGVDAEHLKNLRQALLSCTVENRAKATELSAQYAAADRGDFIDQAFSMFEGEAALQEVLQILEHNRDQGLLNNTNVPRMVRNYFLESAVVIAELGRLVRPGGSVVMVNDNVQYAGQEVPVDLILSEFAAAAGFETERIWTLQRGKGNSSQQMGYYARTEVR
jgi:DNA modification methylase